MDRYYIDPQELNVQDLRLKGEELHHCVHVMRHTLGDTIVLFNGQGLEIKAKIRDINKNEAFLDMVMQSQTPPLPYTITLAQAIPKGKCMDSIIQKATEIGAKQIAPVISERTIVQVDSQKADSKMDKWKLITIEAAKQCGINWLPEILPPVSPKEFIARRQKYDLMLIASLQPDATHFKKVLENYTADHQGQSPLSVMIMIGPEGDFTPAEISMAKSQGCQPITLGPQVLRSETAAIYCLSVIAHELQG